MAQVLKEQIKPQESRTFNSPEREENPVEEEDIDYGDLLVSEPDLLKNPLGDISPEAPKNNAGDHS